MVPVFGMFPLPDCAADVPVADVAGVLAVAGCAGGGSAGVDALEMDAGVAGAEVALAFPQPAAKSRAAPKRAPPPMRASRRGWRKAPCPDFEARCVIGIDPLSRCRAFTPEATCAPLRTAGWPPPYTVRGLSIISGCS